jgi:XapX domain-containing protein
LDFASKSNFATEPSIVLKVSIGLLLGLPIDAGCRFFDVPTPSPPKLVGALLVVAMTVGDITVDK